MPTKNAKTETEGFTAEERAAMKQRAAELRAEGKKGAKQADGLEQVLESIASMAPDDRAIAERVHATVTATAPDLMPKTWYGMPAYANADGKVVLFFQNSGKFNYRYCTLGFQDTANLLTSRRSHARCRSGRISPIALLSVSPQRRPQNVPPCPPSRSLSPARRRGCGWWRRARQQQRGCRTRGRRPPRASWPRPFP
jgi:uncharacterized protein YdhG (YjbR/CyaY superfamily)